MVTLENVFRNGDCGVWYMVTVGVLFVCTTG